MSAKPLPESYNEARNYSWDDYQAHIENLLNTDLSDSNIDDWLKQWSQLDAAITEVHTRMRVATFQDTSDEAAQSTYADYTKTVFTPWQKAVSKLRQKWLASELIPDGWQVRFQQISTQREIFSEENLPLLEEEQQLVGQYFAITGAQTAEWEGEEVTLEALWAVGAEPDRERREKAWRLAEQRTLKDREALNELWRKLFPLRNQIAQNAGFEDYRAYKWKDKGRIDYQPDDSLSLCKEIEDIVISALKRLNQKNLEQFAYENLKPWDVCIGIFDEIPDSQSRPPLKAFTNIEECQEKAESVFGHVHPPFGEYFHTMREENLLDLENRPNKFRVGVTFYYPLSQRPAILMNATGTSGDVDTLLHESGHGFHMFEHSAHPYLQYKNTPMEFSEVASMAMQLLGMPYVKKDKGGYFSEDETRRYQFELMERILRWWALLACYVEFQHWVYTNPELGANPDNCDTKWIELWHRYVPDVDFTGFEDWVATGWQRLMHIYYLPFYMIEYALALLGAVQVWANALENQEKAVEVYHRALKLGNTVSLPELYSTAGAKFAFDAETLKKAVDLIEREMDKLS